jgi:hypothetical protein
MNTLKFGNGEWYGKKDTILAYNDENSNYKPLPFNFSRASKATVINKDGLIEEVGSGQPRIDFKDNTKGALLLEPSRRNSITHSNDFSQSGWDNVAYPVTITSNSIISPDGSLNANLITPTSGSSRHAIRNLSVSATSGATYTLSAFVKKGGSRYVVFGDAGDSLWRVVTADLNNGVITNEYNSSGTITAYKNGWYRITCVITRTNSGTIQFSLGASETSSNSGLPSFNNTSLSVYAYGCQIEANSSYPTSYIPTSGSAVTRLADSCSQTVPDGVIGQTEGVLYAELGSIPSEAIDDVFIELSDGTSNNRILFYADSNSYIRNQIKASGSISSLINTNVTVSSNMKIAITYKSNEAKVFINGVQYGGTDTSVVVPSVNKMNLENYTGARSQTSTLKDVKLYNTVLTDQELIALTQV